MTDARVSSTASALAATLGLAAASRVVPVRQMNGMDMGVATELGSFASFIALWVNDDGRDDAAGRGPTVLRRAHTTGCVGDVPLFVGSYLAVWTSSASPCTRRTDRTGCPPRKCW
jgi:hypothetical protein